MNLLRLPTVDVGTDVRNRVTSARELEIWKTQPDQWFGYYSFPALSHPFKRGVVRDLTGAQVTTWMGDKLGDILLAHVFPHNFGGRIVTMQVRGTNGAVYYGRASFDWGTCITLRKVKGSKP